MALSIDARAAIRQRSRFDDSHPLGRLKSKPHSSLDYISAIYFARAVEGTYVKSFPSCMEKTKGGPFKMRGGGGRFMS